MSKQYFNIQIPMQIQISFVLCLLGWMTMPCAVGQNAEEVYARAVPSVVQIESVAGKGSGVVLTANGLMITNQHVVEGQEKVTLKARVKRGNAVVKVTLEQVPVEKIHQRYDLALLQAKPPQEGDVFLPAVMAPREMEVAPGAPCYALGNPGLGDVTLDHTITQGLISAASHKVEDLEYLQFSAPVNPGNSGGALLDKQGRLIGIVTLKINHTLGVGLGIPTRKLDMREFVSTAEWKSKQQPSPEKERVYSLTMQQGRGYLSQSDKLKGNERVAKLMEAGDVFERAATLDRTKAEPLIEICQILRTLEINDQAKKVLERAAAVEPDHPGISMLRGELFLEQYPDKVSGTVLNEVIGIWFQGLKQVREKTKGYSQICAWNIFQMYERMNKLREAAYMLRWSESLSANDSWGDPAYRAEAWAKLARSTKLGGDYDRIRDKAFDFSQAQMEAFAKGEPLANSGSNGGAARPGSQAAVPDQVQRDQMRKDLNAAFLPGRIEVPATGLELPLPGTPANAVMASAGWQLVMHFPEIASLGVFNVATGKMDGLFDCAEPRPLLAAGGQQLVVYLPGAKTFEFYDLKSMSRTAVVDSPAPGPVAFIGMGTLNPSRVFAICVTPSDESRRPPGWAAGFLTLPDYRWLPLQMGRRGGSSQLIGESFSSRPLPEYRFLGSMDEGGTMAGIALDDKKNEKGPTVSWGLSNPHAIRLYDDRIMFSAGEGLYSWPTVSADGKYLVGNKKMAVVSPDMVMQPIEQGYNTGLLKRIVIDGFPGVLTLERGEVKRELSFHVARLFDLVPLYHLPVNQRMIEVEERVNYDSEATDFGNQANLFASAGADRIALILSTAKKIVLFPLDLSKATADQVGKGQELVRQVKLPVGATARLMKGPAGLVFDAEKSALVWKVPEEVAAGQSFQVILVVQGADGKEEYLIEKIVVQ